MVVDTCTLYNVYTERDVGRKEVHETHVGKNWV